MSFRKKTALIVGGFLAAAVILGVGGHFSDALARLCTSAVVPVQKVISRAITPVAKLRDGIAAGSEIREENERLKAENNALKAENRSSEEYIKENERLKELLRLKENMVGESVLAARVISVDFDNFSQTIMINRGSEDGISIDNVVTSAAGVVGRVSDVGSDWARVTTLLSPNNSMGVRVSRTGDVAVCEGEPAAAKKNLLKLCYISGSAQLIEGDIIETSGLGGIYPPGLICGRISEIKKDNSGTVDYAAVEPGVDFSKLYEVLVITSGERESISPEVVAKTSPEEYTDFEEQYNPEEAIG